MDGVMHGLMHGWIAQVEGLLHMWMDCVIDKWMNRVIHAQMEGLLAWVDAFMH